MCTLPNTSAFLLILYHSSWYVPFFCWLSRTMLHTDHIAYDWIIYLSSTSSTMQHSYTSLCAWRGYYSSTTDAFLSSAFSFFNIVLFSHFYVACSPNLSWYTASYPLIANHMVTSALEFRSLCLSRRLLIEVLILSCTYLAIGLSVYQVDLILFGFILLLPDS